MNGAEARAAILRLKPTNLVYPEVEQAKKRAKKRLLAIALLGGRCSDCQMAFPDHPEVYEFDHNRGVKTANISRLLHRSWSYLSKELKKCDLVCANCHRIRTAHRREENRCESHPIKKRV